MNLELNVVRFNNEDVIATSCTETVLTVTTNEKHAFIDLSNYLSNGDDVVFKDYAFKYDVDRENNPKLKKVDGVTYPNGMIEGAHLSKGAVADDDVYHYDATKGIYACTTPKVHN